MPTVSRHVSASATAPGLGLQDAGGDLGGRGEPCGFAAALERRWRVAHNSTGPTTAKRDTHLTRKSSDLHLTNALLWSRVSGPPLSLVIADRISPPFSGEPIGLHPRRPGPMSAMGIGLRRCDGNNSVV